MTATQTLEALAVDAAGNPGAVGTFAYTISPPVTPPASGGGGAPAGGTPAGTTIINQTILGPGGVATSPAVAAITASGRPALAVKQLGLAPRIKQSKAQKRGLRLVMRLASGTETVKVNVYRKTGSGLKLISSGFRSPSAAGLYHVAQSHLALRRQLTKGRYEVQVTPGYSRTELGTTAKAAFQVV